MFQKIKNTYHLLKAIIANVWYGFPSRKLSVIGVTGTDGKTTTSHLIYHILQAAGKKASLISSVYAKIGGKEYTTGLHTTTPDAFYVQKLIAAAVSHEDEYLVLEVTSHALDQNRVFGIHFTAGVLTNITREHLDYHKTYNQYLQAKAKLFFNTEKIIINTDDNSFAMLSTYLKTMRKTFHTYGFSKKADFQNNIGTIINQELPKFNSYNFLAAYSTAMLLNIPEKIIIHAIKTFKLPTGRLDAVYENSFKIIVDFAHTPNAIDSLLQYIKKTYGETGRIIHVFGSAGLRDFTKRPLMGEMSGKWADAVIITEEDYRTEDPEKISKQIAEGLEKNGFMYKKDFTADKKTYTVIIDRKTAIKKAISIAQKRDVIILTGKGHEQSLCRGTVEYPWDDRKEVLKIINNIKM